MTMELVWAKKCLRHVTILKRFFGAFFWENHIWLPISPICSTKIRNQFVKCVKQPSTSVFGGSRGTHNSLLLKTNKVEILFKQANSNEPFSMSRVTQSTVHRTDKELYTEELPSGICSVLCSRSCSHIARVPCKRLMLLVGSSRLYSIHYQVSCSSPIHLVTETVEQGSSFGPNSDQPGRQLSSCVGWVQPV